MSQTTIQGLQKLIELPMKRLYTLRQAVETGTLPPVPEEYLREPTEETLFHMPGTQEVLESEWPTLKVHPFLDFGEKTTAGGTTFSVLYPMLPFGLHVEHSGPFHGFTTVLRDGAQSVSTSGDFLAHELPAGEQRPQLSVAVTAVEPPAPVPSPRCGRCGVASDSAPATNISSLAVLAGVLIARRRRTLTT